MLWLFGQIWLWLLVAFALGALAGALLTWPARRRRDADARASADARDADDGPVSTSAETTSAAPRSARSMGGTATFAPVEPGSLEPGSPAYSAPVEIPGAGQRAEEATGQQPHHAHVPGQHRGRRRAPRTPDVEPARSTAGDGGDNHVIGILDETTGSGRTSGTLPSRRAWHTRNEWPDEADEWATEHRIPRSGG
ncbi:hypothetical protein FB384_002302 [Prauserella sediminis]|uniref:Uncharacterized protein n=1 Tax=Prauserella sediminis TaxID=577680 RepID=A0A839XR43_9PSEU|nr:hypothetical protein [Prauserella sediminis]MBB3663398.1 hypothetical protein [Prauserella sediminis]